jgi:hypothetical protein
MSADRFHPGQIEVHSTERGYFVGHKALAFPSSVNLSKAAPGAVAAPRQYSPRTAGSHEAVLGKFRDRHSRLVLQANDLRRERDLQNMPADTGTTEETDQ